MRQDAATAVRAVKPVDGLDDGVVDELDALRLMRLQHTHKVRVHADGAGRVAILVLVEDHLRNSGAAAGRQDRESRGEIGAASFAGLLQLDPVELALLLFEAFASLSLCSDMRTVRKTKALMTNLSALMVDSFSSRLVRILRKRTSF